MPHRHFEILPTGLKILIKEVRAFPVVLFDMWVRAGSRDESGDEWGMSHFLEHMLFNGNRQLSKDEMKRAIFEIGGDDNAATWQDVTNYFMLVTSDQFERGLEIHHALMTSPILSDDEFAREREVVLEEIRLYEDSPSETIREKAENLLFSNLGYNHPILGTSTVVGKMTPEMLRAYYSRRYSPENMLLVVAGDFDSERVLPLIRDKYSDFVRQDRAKASAFDDRGADGSKVLTIASEIDATYLSVYFKGPPLKSADTYALDILMDALGGCRSARLNSRLFEDLNLVTSIEASNRSYMDAGLLGIDVEMMDSAKVHQVVDEISRILTGVASQGLSDEEIERSRRRIHADHVFRDETLWGISAFYGQVISLTGLEVADSYLERILSVTPSQVVDVARRYLTPENMVVGVNYPENDDVEVSTRGFIRPSIGASGRVLNEHGQHVGQAFQPAIHAESRSGRLESLPHKRVTQDDTKLGPVIREQLPNGLTWLFQHNPSNPAVSIQVFVRGGLAHETWDTNGIAQVTLRALRKGTVGKPVDALNLAFDSLGARMDSDCDFDYLSIESLFPARDFREGFGLLSELVLQPSFPEVEVEKVRDEALGLIIQNNDDIQQVGLDRLRLEIFGCGHPYGRPPCGRTEAVSALKLDDIRGFHEKVYSPENIIVSVAGDVRADDVRKLIEENFGPLVSRGKEGTADFPSPSEIRGERIFAIPRDKSQVRIAIGKPGPSVSDPDFPAAKMTDTILGGTSYSRLFGTLRDREGLAYDAYTDIRRARLSPLFITSMGTAPENRERAIEAIRHEFKEMGEHGPSPDELANARTWLRADTLIRRQGNLHLAAILGRNESLGLPCDFETRLLELYGEVTRDDVIGAARKYCDPENLVITVCGPVPPSC